jgi:riboflavin kinase / FMN adenylyltransferase
MDKMQGEVIHGQNKGNKLGYPTANVRFKGKLDQGVYWGWAIVEGKKYKTGIMYREGTDVLEAHIIDFQGDIYGKQISLELVGKIREVVTFKNDGELAAQIKKDIEKIKEL